MTATATLTASCQDGIRVLELDCRHGTTTSGVIGPEDARPGDVAMVQTMLITHWLSEGCACPRALWRRYGLDAAFAAAIAEVGP